MCFFVPFLRSYSVLTTCLSQCESSDADFPKNDRNQITILLLPSRNKEQTSSWSLTTDVLLRVGCCIPSEPPTWNILFAIRNRIDGGNMPKFPVGKRKSNIFPCEELCPSVNDTNYRSKYLPLMANTSYSTN